MSLDLEEGSGGRRMAPKKQGQVYHPAPMHEQRSATLLGQQDTQAYSLRLARQPPLPPELKGLSL